MIQEATNKARDSSDLVHKFNYLINVELKTICEKFLDADINRDGELGFDGFKAVLLKSETHDYGFEIKDIPEIFNLTATNGYFVYKNYILGNLREEITPEQREYAEKAFSKLKV